ncbi:MAG: DNA repair exonuclease [Desulfuromonadales bacterium]|nr:DNA repair exonuclease [Desulfuromonadales bacterium]NIR34050.1 DNA repair exonuclease [Desulfuromonadales bacterium]NIS44101.1 DNA repair exonuclease [Desulfuromonadales bacterium]
MIRLLHTADLLLDSPFADLGDLADRRRGDQLRTFEKLINLAIKNEVDLAVFAGNLFATPRPEPEIVQAVCEGLQRLVDRQIVPVVLPGGLDGVLTPDNIYRLSAIPGLLLSDIRRLRRPLSLELKSTPVHLYGFAWSGNEADPAALSSLKRVDQPGVHIGVLQAGTDDDPSQYFRELPAVDADMLRRWGLDYVALGNRRTWREIGDEKTTHGIFPGTPEGTSFRETGQRHCALVTLGEGTPQVEKLVVNSRTLEEAKIDLTGVESNHAIGRAIAEHAHPEVILRAVLKGQPAIPPDLPELHAQVHDQFAGLVLEDRTVLTEGAFAEKLRKLGKPFASLLEEAAQLRSQAATEAEKRLLEEAFRTALARLEKTTGGLS